MKKPDVEDPPSKGLVRYHVISAYLALAPKRGERGPLLAELATREWTGPDGKPFRVEAETIRVWVRRYRRGGLAALEDKARPRIGVKALSEPIVALACDLKREVPERSLDRVIEILEDMGHVEKGVVKRATLHRALRAHGLSQRVLRVPDTQDLDRFEAAAPNDLWQSDMLAGPMLPDPDRPGEMRRAWLYAFIDDHSRLLLHGRFSFRGDLPSLELVFRRALQKYGVPRRVYYDNGAVYRSPHMQRIVAELGLHGRGISYTKVGRPMGHGKIEAFNRLVRSAFIAELKASRITTLDSLNEAFTAWADLKYNRRVHGETDQTPHARWHASPKHVRPVDEEKLRLAFLWNEMRTPDKAGVFSLFGTEYQVGPALARRKIEVRYDPERLDEIEVWHRGAFAERVRPFAVREHRRDATLVAPPPAPPPPPTDYLGHLVNERRKQVHGDVAPVDRRRAADAAVVALLADRLAPDARDDAAVRRYLRRYGPFDVADVADMLDRMLATGPNDQHPSVYLDAVRERQEGLR